MKMGIWALVCLSFMASGCAVVSSSDVNPSTIYSQYSARYDEGANQLDFNASFFVGRETGTYVELSGKSSVTINSEPMTKNKTLFNQIIYERQMSVTPQALSSGYTFSYTNDAGDVYRNSAQIPARVWALALPNNSASIAAGLTVSWQSATALGTRETVQAILKSADAATSASSWSGGQSGQISFSAQDMKNFKPGPATITVCRQSYLSGLQGTSAGGSMSVSYCSAPVNLTLTQ